MTFKEELGFEITKVFFDDYNEELKEEEKVFSKEFLRVIFNYNNFIFII